MKVLIIKQGAVGDLVLALPVIGRIIQHHARDECYVLSTPECAFVFEDWAELKHRVLLRPRRGLMNNLGILRLLRSLRPDRIYDLQGNDLSALLCAFSGAGVIVGSRTHFPYTHHPEERYVGQCHIFDRLNSVLRSAAISTAPPELAFPIPRSVAGEVDDWLRKRGVRHHRLVLLHAGSSLGHPEKRWSGFGALAEQLCGRGFLPIWIGAADDRSLNRELARRCGLDASEEFGFSGLVSLGRRACFAVTSDSAPMHMLAYSGIPVFALFGLSQWRRCHALGQAHNVIAASSLCAGGKEPVSIDQIGVGDVMRKLRDSRLLTGD